ncbi:MAG: hypothetical protein IT385_20265 [Deltaproteobacteria bacterium]|nr:hypothetical protein [Deltaproteobacteria bacterium]
MHDTTPSHLIRITLLGLALVACGDDGAGGKDTGATTTSTATDTTSSTDGTTATDSATSTATDSTTSATDTTVAVDTTTGSCSEQDLEACRYLDRGLELTRVEGFATTEPVTGRTLPLVARIPKKAGPLPVVLWSHGGGFRAGGENESATWGAMMARHGYVVIHVGHAALEAGDAAALCDAASIPEGDCVPSEDEDSNGLLAIGRSFDLEAVLDDLSRLSQLSVNRDGPALDLDRVALAGWSGGSRGPMVLMGAKIKPTTNAPLFTNEHAMAKAAFFMSPAGPPYAGYFIDDEESTWDAMRGPTFWCTGENDVKPDKVELTGAIRRAGYPTQPADGKRLLLYSNLPVGVGGHGTYNLGDLESDDARLVRLSQAIASVARAFLDASLFDDAQAKAWLASDKADVLAGDVDWERR